MARFGQHKAITYISRTSRATRMSPAQATGARRDLQLQHAVRCATTPEQADVGARCATAAGEPCGAACSKTTSSEQTFNITNAHLKPIYNINTNRSGDGAGAARTGHRAHRARGDGRRSADCTGEPEDGAGRGGGGGARGAHESSSSEESTVSTVPPAAAPPDDEPDSDVTSDRMEPSPLPPCPPPPLLPPEAPPSSPVTAWILGPNSCSLGPMTWPTMPPSDASPFCGASMPYCLFSSMFCRSSVSTNLVLASISELIFYNREQAGDGPACGRRGRRQAALAPYSPRTRSRARRS